MLGFSKIGWDQDTSKRASKESKRNLLEKEMEMGRRKVDVAIARMGWSSRGRRGQVGGSWREAAEEGQDAVRGRYTFTN